MAFGVIETEAIIGDGDMAEALVVSWIEVADKPPNMAPAAVTRTMTIEAAMNLGVNRG